MISAVDVSMGGGGGGGGGVHQPETGTGVIVTGFRRGRGRGTCRKHRMTRKTHQDDLLKAEGKGLASKNIKTVQNNGEMH